VIGDWWHLVAPWYSRQCNRPVGRARLPKGLRMLSEVWRLLSSEITYADTLPSRPSLAYALSRYLTARERGEQPDARSHPEAARPVFGIARVGFGAMLARSTSLGCAEASPHPRWAIAPPAGQKAPSPTYLQSRITNHQPSRLWQNRLRNRGTDRHHRCIDHLTQP
jgi:hypothetical protein